MNKRIKKLMEEAGLYDFVIEAMGMDEEMNKFAELIEAAARADEREQCAKLCDEVWDGDTYTYAYSIAANDLAIAIRARGTT